MPVRAMIARSAMLVTAAMFRTSAGVFVAMITAVSLLMDRRRGRRLVVHVPVA